MDSTDQVKQSPLIMTGMHRSGTSLVAALLQSAGLDIGEQLLEANPGNPQGHFENVEILEFHRCILYALGINDIGWTVEQNLHIPEYYVDEAKVLVENNASSTQPWGWKEPRTTLFLDFWNRLLPRAKFLLIYRCPWEVIDSLYRRGDDVFYNNPEFALKIWIAYNQKLLDFYFRFPDKCILINLITVIQNPISFIELVNQKFDLPLAPPADLYNKSLLNKEVSNSQRPILIRRYFPDVFDLYQQLNQAAEFVDNTAFETEDFISPTAWLLQDWSDLRKLQRSSKAETNKLQEQIHTYYHELQATQTELQSACGEVEAVRREIQTFQEWSYGLRDSRDWFENQWKLAQSDLWQTQSQLEQMQAQLQSTQTQLQQTRNQFQTSQTAFEQAQTQLQHLQTELQQTQTQLEQTQTQLEQTETDLQKSREKLQEKHTKLQRVRNNLQLCRQEITETHNRITAMESSKFWRLRSSWFRFKRSLGLSADE